MARVITPEAQISYPNIFQPNEKGKYTASLVFAPGTDLTALKKAAMEVVLEKFGEKKGVEMIKKGIVKIEGGAHHTFRTDAEAKGYPEGSVFINVSSRKKPGVVSIFPGPDGRPLPITNEEEIYPGAVVIASVNPYWYDVDGNKGVAWGLNNIQKRRDGERLDGRQAAEDEFEADPNAQAELSALTGESEAEAPEVAAVAVESGSASALEALLK